VDDQNLSEGRNTVPEKEKKTITGVGANSPVEQHCLHLAGLVYLRPGREQEDSDQLWDKRAQQKRREEESLQSKTFIPQRPSSTIDDDCAIGLKE